MGEVTCSYTYSHLEEELRRLAADLHLPIASTLQAYMGLKHLCPCQEAQSSLYLGTYLHPVTVPATAQLYASRKSRGEEGGEKKITEN